MAGIRRHPASGQTSLDCTSQPVNMANRPVPVPLQQAVPASIIIPASIINGIINDGSILATFSIVTLLIVANGRIGSCGTLLRGIRVSSPVASDASHCFRSAFTRAAASSQAA